MLLSPLAQANTEFFGVWKSRILPSNFPFWSFGRVYFDFRADVLRREVTLGQHRLRSEFWRVLELSQTGGRFQVEHGQQFQAEITMLSPTEMNFCVAAFCSRFERLLAMPELRTGSHSIPPQTKVRVSWGNEADEIIVESQTMFPDSYDARLGRESVIRLHEILDLNVQTYLIDADPLAVQSYAFSLTILGEDVSSEPQKPNSLGQLNFSLPYAGGSLNIIMEFLP